MCMFFRSRKSFLIHDDNEGMQMHTQARAWGRASGATDLGPQIPGASPYIPYRSIELVDYDYMRSQGPHPIYHTGV
jgi:hypothetical protein